MAGLPWFKLAGDFFAHPKTLELQAELADPAADVYVVNVGLRVPRGRIWPTHWAQRGDGVGARGVLAGRTRALGVGSFARGLLEQEPDALVVHDWAKEQGAHVAKVERDRNRPRADRRISHLSPVPARESRGDVAESREGPEVERERERDSKNSPTERTASPTAAVAASHTFDDIPDATDDAQSVDERPALVLETQQAGKQPRKPSAGEALYFRMEDRRQKACEEAGKPYIPAGWSNSRMNRDLGPIARAEKGNPEAWRRFQGAWLEFITDEAPGNAADPWPLDWFWAQRAKYEARAAHAEEAA